MKLTLPQFLLVLVLIFFVWVMLDWLWSVWRDHAASRRAKRKYRQCHLCGKTYAEIPKVKLSDCPDCSAANSKKGHRRLA